MTFVIIIKVFPVSSGETPEDLTSETLEDFTRIIFIADSDMILWSLILFIMRKTGVPPVLVYKKNRPPGYHCLNRILTGGRNNQSLRKSIPRGRVQLLQTQLERMCVLPQEVPAGRDQFPSATCYILPTEGDPDKRQYSRRSH